MARAPFGFAPWPVIPTAPDDEATHVGRAPGQMPVDPRRDGSVQPTAAGRDISRAVGAAAGGMAQGLLDAAKLPGDVYAGRIDPMSDEGIRRAGDLAGFAMTGGIGGAAKQAGEAVLGSGPIRAYHGSPHDFDRFSLAHIGTGEGNQGFGRGLYFAGDERIAKSYRDDLSKVPVLKFDGDASGLNIASPQNARDLAAFGFETGGGNLDAGLGNIRMMAEFDPRLAPFADEAARHLRDGRVALGPKSPGHMYEVGIDADPARLLDWDAPLSGQSPAVRSFAADRLADPQARAAIETTARQRLGGPADMTGQDLYRGLTGYDDAAKAAVSADMRAAGIPGVQYMDTGSRGFGGGAQTRQYVTFGDDIVSILRKYGVAGTAGVGGAAAALAPGDTQAAPSPSGVPMAFGFGSLSGLPADVLMRQRQGMPSPLSLGDPAAMMLGAEQEPARAPVAAQPQEPPVVAPFGFGALAPRGPAAAGAGMGFGPGSPGAGLPLPPQEPAATGATAPAIRPQARPAQSPPPAPAADGAMTSAPLPPARPPEFGSSAAPAAPLDIKPPAQAVAPSAAEPSTWDKVSGFLGNNSDMLIGIGTGLMSTPGIGRGLAAGVQNGVAMQQAAAVKGLAQAKQAVEMQKLAKEQQNVGANALYVKNKIPGIPDAVASSLGSNSSFMTELYKGLIPAQELFKQFTDQSGNIWSQNQRTGQATVALKAEEDKTQTPLTDPTARLRAGIRQDDKRSAWLDANGKVTYESGQPNTQVTVNNAVNPILKGLGDQFVEGAANARSAAEQVRAIGSAREQLDRDGGIISGFRANDRLALQKVGALLGITDPSAIQNTESLKAALKPMVLEAVKGLGSQPSNSDRTFAEDFSGGNIALDEGSIRRIMDINERAARAKIERHNALADEMLKTQPDLGAVGPMLRINMPAAYAPPAPAQSAPAAAPVQAAPTAPARPRRVFDPATGAFR